MSISSIYGQNYYTNTIYNQQNNRQQMQTEFVQLGQDLQSGNLTGAQSDFASIQQMFSANQNQNLTASSTTPASSTTSTQTQNPFQQLQTDFIQLGQDLQSGNLTQAQTDYSNIKSLQQSMHSNSQAHGMHHHHHGGGVIEALLQELNSDSTTNASTVAQNTSADNSSLQNQNSSSQSQSMLSIESLIAQYMQNMLTGMSAQTQEVGSLNLTNLNLTI